MPRLRPVTLLLPLACALPLAAAEPPLPREHLIDSADLIVTATVDAVLEREVKVERGTDHEGLVTLRVDGCEKGGARPGALLYAHYKRTGQRPEGWAGPTGQRSRLESGGRVRAFLCARPEGGYALLSPNGAEPVDAGGEVPYEGGATVEGLERTVGDLLKALQGGDKKRFAELARGLRLPSPADWFRQVFGEEASAALAAEYEQDAQTLVATLRKVLDAAKERGAPTFTAFRAEGHRAIGVQRRAAFAMRRKVTLYSVRFEGGETLWSFAHTGGQFRWVGKLRALPSREPLVVKVDLGTMALVPSQAPQHVLRITIKNESEKTVERVPTRYDGATVMLEGRGSGHLWPLALRVAERVRQEQQPLKPGEERVLLEVKLSEVLDPAPRSRWSWDWGAHPVPPLTPIHRYRMEGYEPAATFYMSVEAGGRTLHSQPITIRVATTGG